MIDIIIAHIYQIVGSILLACFVAYLTFRSFLKRRRIEASDKFRNTILTEFSTLYPDGIFHVPANKGSETVKMLRVKHHIISAAVNAYCPHVRDKAGFNKAWDDFTGIDRFRDKDEEPRYNQYSFQGRNNHFYESPKEMFVKNVEQLLKFTK